MSPSPSRELFLAAISLVYFAAFGSIYLQAPGLYGDNGVMPVAALLARYEQSEAPSAFVPFLKAWSQGVPPAECLELIALAGTILSAVASAGCATAPVLLALLALYKLCFSVGQTFLSFQWDILLLEVGAQAVLLAPLWSAAHEPPSRAVVWLLRFTLFKLMLMSGVVKISSGCPTWSELTALDYHFATQCIPTPLAWYAHQLPSLLLKAGVAATFVIEIPGSLLLLLPLRGARLLGAALQLLLQLLICASGNYNFFNALTAALCLPLLIDPAREPQAEERNGGALRAIWRVLARGALVACVAGLAWSTWAMIAVDWPIGARAPRGLRLAVGMHDLQPLLSAWLPPLCTRAMPALLAAATLHDVASALLPGWLGPPAAAAAAATGAAATLPAAAGAIPAERAGAAVPGSPIRLEESDLFLDPPPPPARGAASAVGTAGRRLLGAARLLLLGAAAAALCGSSAVHLGQIAPPLRRPGGSMWGALAPWQQAAHELLDPWRLTSGYGLFRRMTGVGEDGRVARPEIVLEASVDGQRWQEVEFGFKPGDVRRAPPWCAPHQPRLDWQMWFAALGDYGRHPWLVHLVAQLLQGTPEVHALLVPRRIMWPLAAGALPHAPRPPRVIRAQLYHYDFMPANSSDATGAWWARRHVREYLPALELSNPSLQDFLRGQGWQADAVHRCERYEFGGEALPACAAGGCGDHSSLPAAWRACTWQAGGCDGVVMVATRDGMSFQTRVYRTRATDGEPVTRGVVASWRKQGGRCPSESEGAVRLARLTLRMVRPRDIELLGGLAAAALLARLVSTVWVRRRAVVARERAHHKHKQKAE